MTFASRTLLAIVVLTMTVACKEQRQPLAQPNYKPPTNWEAKDAFKAALKTDRIDNPYTQEKIDSQAKALLLGTHHANNARNIANKDAITLYGALQKFEIVNCKWERVSHRKIPKRSILRLEKFPDAAYNCRYKVLYQINPPHGHRKPITFSGYFFEKDRDITYAGYFADPY